MLEAGCALPLGNDAQLDAGVQRRLGGEGGGKHHAVLRLLGRGCSYWARDRGPRQLAS